MRNLRRRGLVLGSGLALAVAAGGATAYAAASGGPIDSSGHIHACYSKTASHGSHSVVLQNAGTSCSKSDTAIEWNVKGPKGATGAKGAKGATGAPGPQGPSGVVSMTEYTPSGAPNNTGGWAFLGSPPEFFFSNADTAAEVTGTVDEASDNGSPVEEFLGVCYQPEGGSVTDVSAVEPEFTASADSYFAQTVSGDVGDLASGDYFVGLCNDDQTSNMANGLATVTVTIAQTADGVTYDGTALHAKPGRQQ
jgi:hypothetical protein